MAPFIFHQVPILVSRMVLALVTSPPKPLSPVSYFAVVFIFKCLIITSQKTMLLIEEKKVPVKIELVPMRSYGDKPREFMQKVTSGLLPAIEVNGKVITESQVIMDLLDRWHPEADGYKPMMPAEDDSESRKIYQILAQLEREYVNIYISGTNYNMLPL
jgi:hypothetical protein